jgi:hypothetical protein
LPRCVRGYGQSCTTSSTSRRVIVSVRQPGRRPRCARREYRGHAPDHRAGRDCPCPRWELAHHDGLDARGRGAGQASFSLKRGVAFGISDPQPCVP